MKSYLENSGLMVKGLGEGVKGLSSSCAIGSTLCAEKSVFNGCIEHVIIAYGEKGIWGVGGWRDASKLKEMVGPVRENRSQREGTRVPN